MITAESWRGRQGIIHSKKKVMAPIPKGGGPPPVKDVGTGPLSILN